MRVSLHLLLPVVFLLPKGLAAQQPSAPAPLDSGAVVRFRETSGDRIAGTLLTPITPEATSFRFCPYPGSPCPAGSDRISERLTREISQLQVRSGTELVPGILVGAPTGVLFGFWGIQLDESFSETSLSTSQKVGVIAVSTLVWTGLGALVGWGIDKWKPWP